ncbi:MAG: hypothetical protein IPF90_00040 [Actinomycetales bacterium]|jgi:hypothetical protein|nr:hypothetical protein [Candidatus Phosphoribacter baldrii]
MLTELVFPDPAGYADLATLVRRAKQADPDAAVRLQASGGVLRVWVGVLPGSGLLADGAAVGVRGIALAGPAEGSTAGGSTDNDLDLVCSASALLDRFARDGVGATSMTLPTVSAYAAWSGALPATGGWTPAGVLSASDLIAAATSGIAEISEGVGPAGTVAGARAVEELRRRVWARPVPVGAVGARDGGAGPPVTTIEAPGVGVDVTAGAAFAAYVLGFLPDATASIRVWRSGRWVRLQTQVGHVVARP